MFTKSKIRAFGVARLAVILCQLSSVSPALALSDTSLACAPTAKKGVIGVVIEKARLELHTAHLQLFGVGY
jgi:hypothetical protein